MNTSTPWATHEKGATFIFTITLVCVDKLRNSGAVEDFIYLCRRLSTHPKVKEQQQQQQQQQQQNQNNQKNQLSG